MAVSKRPKTDGYSMSAKAGQRVRVFWPTEFGDKPLFTGVTVAGAPWVGHNRVRPDGDYIELPPAFRLELLPPEGPSLREMSERLETALDRAGREGYDLEFVAVAEEVSEHLRKLTGRT